jgi:predicted nucleic acid-binding protein
MTKTVFVLDTNAAIYLLKCESVPEPIASADFAMSIITRMELLSKRDITSEDEAELRSFMDDLTLVPINEAVEAATIALRRSIKINLPNAIIAATSIALNAILLTHDAKLLSLSCPGYRARDIPELSAIYEQPLPPDLKTLV